MSWGLSFLRANRLSHRCSDFPIIRTTFLNFTTFLRLSTFAHSAELSRSICAKAACTINCDVLSPRAWAWASMRSRSSGDIRRLRRDCLASHLADALRWAALVLYPVSSIIYTSLSNIRLLQTAAIYAISKHRHINYNDLCTCL